MFIRLHSKIVALCNSLRQWGRGCACHEALLLAGKKISCFRKGRRLREASARIRQFQQDVAALLSNMTLELCEQDFDLLDEGRGVLRTLRSWTTKFGFLDEPPYMFCNIECPEVAQSFLDQVGSVPRSDHHPLTLHLYDQFVDIVRSIADVNLPCLEGC